MRGVTAECGATFSRNLFQLTRLMRGVTLSHVRDRYTCNGISTHTPHARRDKAIQIIRIHQRKFQLTRLMRGVTRLFSNALSSVLFQLTRLMRGVTKIALVTFERTQFQLTRLMRGVTIYGQAAFVYDEISTHTPHARRDCPAHL